MKGRYLIVLGIRPDIINYQPLVKLFQKKNIDFKIVHTGQHYSYFFDKLFFEQLNFPKPDYNLKIGSGTQSQQLGRLVQRLEKILRKEKPDLIFSFSDANSALSALVATKIGIKVAHLEAGMRSYDWRMPEEKNRRIIDSISDFLFTPTKTTKTNLLDEGIPPHKIFQVGKPIYEVLENFKKEIDGNNILDRLKLEKKKYFLVTAHRPENIEIKRPLKNIFDALSILYRKYGKEIVFPIHPRTKKSVRKFGIRLPKGVRIVEPVGFLEFSKLEKNAFCCLTDSGTVQEDSCIFKVPCVTMRISTERTETVEVGANIVSGLNKEHIVEAVQKMVNKKQNWKNPYGKPNCAKKILKILEEKQNDIQMPKVWWDHPKIQKNSSISAYHKKWHNSLLPDEIFD